MMLHDQGKTVTRTGNPDTPFGEMTGRDRDAIAGAIHRRNDDSVMDAFFGTLPVVGAAKRAGEALGFIPDHLSPVDAALADTYGNSTWASLFGDHSDDPGIDARVQGRYDALNARNAQREVDNARNAGVWIPDNVPLSVQLSYARSGRGPGAQGMQIVAGAGQAEQAAPEQAAEVPGIYTPPVGGVLADAPPSSAVPPAGVPMPPAAELEQPEWLKYLLPYLPHIQDPGAPSSADLLNLGVVPA